MMLIQWETFCLFWTSLSNCGFVCLYVKIMEQNVEMEDILATIKQGERNFIFSIIVVYV